MFFRKSIDFFRKLIYNKRKVYSRKLISYESEGCEMSKYKPILGITIGDPAGVGPEIILKSFRKTSLYESCRPIVIGCSEALERAKEAIGEREIQIRSISQPEEAKYETGVIDVIETGDYDLSTLKWGEEQKIAGQISIDAINKSIELGMIGKIDAVTTAPINKRSIKMVGVEHAGHTEIYLDQTKVPYVLTMFDCFKMKVFHLSRHLSLRNAIDYVTTENVLNEIIRIDKELNDIGLSNSLIAVAGLNPHSGEDGLFGDEEIREIIPAIEEARSKGFNVVGPIPPDTLFARGKTGEFDAILALYHDQGHIPCKTLDLERTVSVTLGLPFIRCTVDHGTAFDIAGKGIATNLSMMSAINVTLKYAVAQLENKK